MSLEILLEKTQFVAEDLVTGQLKFTTSQDRRIYGIHVHFVGYEYCENKALDSVPYHKKWLLDGHTVVHGHNYRSATSVRNPVASEGVDIREGTYFWPFSFRIPRNIPPSCNFRNGKLKIEYAILGVVDIPWDTKCLKVTQPLQIGILYADLDRREVFRKEKSFLIHGPDFSPVKRNVLRMDGSINKSVTYGGDKVVLSVKLDNNSGSAVTSVKCKLLQYLLYGNSAKYQEKQLVMKYKHKDAKFPLIKGEYSIQVPLIIPILENQPSVKDATLLEAKYQFSLTARVKTGKNLKIYIPLLLSSFPSSTIPIPIFVEKKPRSEKKIKIKEKEKKANGEKVPNLIDLDFPSSPVPPLPSSSDFSSSPISSTSLNPVHLSSDRGGEMMEPPFSSFPSPPLREETEFSNNSPLVQAMESTLEDLNQFAHTGLYSEEVEGNEMRSQLTKDASDLSRVLSQLNSNAEIELLADPRRQEALVQRVRYMANVAKGVAIGIPSEERGDLLSSIVGVAMATEGLLTTTPSSSSPSSSSYFEHAVRNLGRSLDHLLIVASNLPSSPSWKDQLEQLGSRIKEMERERTNPFFFEGNIAATPSSVLRSLSCLRSSLSNLLPSLSSPLLASLLQEISVTLESLVTDLKGLSSKYPSISGHINQLLRDTLSGCESFVNLLLVAPTTINSGELYKEIFPVFSSLSELLDSLQQSETSPETSQESQEIFSPSEVEREAVKEASFEEEAENKLREILGDVTNWSMRLHAVLNQNENQPKSSNPFLEEPSPTVPSSSAEEAKEIGEAVRNLLLSAVEAQHERVQANLSHPISPSSSYHFEPKWTNGFLSSSQEVGLYASQLIEILTSKNLKEEDFLLLKSLARGINASATQVVISALSAPGDPNSHVREKLRAAARKVTEATGKLLQVFDSNLITTPPVTSSSSFLPTEGLAETKIKELEASIQISQLEQGLEKARIHLASIRKQSYQH